MPLPNRAPDLLEPLPPIPGQSRSERIQTLICAGVWSGNDNIVLIYWSSQNGGRWVAWTGVDPLI